jgi:hypothetical protein
VIRLGPLLLFLLGCLLPGIVVAQNATPQAPNTLGNATSFHDADQFPLCQQTGGCDLTGNKPVVQGTPQQMYEYQAGKLGVPINSPVIPRVANNTALKTLGTGGLVSGQATVFRQGFLTAGDGGSAFYVYSSSACSLNAGAGDNGSQVAASSGGCWLVDLNGQPPNVLVWGADKTGAADSTAAVQNTGNYVCTLANGGTVYFPPGRFLMHDVTFSCNSMHIVGSGKGGTPSTTDGGVTSGVGATVIDCSAMTDHCIQLGPNSGTPAANRFVGGSIERLSTYNSAGTGVVFRIHQQFGGHVRDVWMETPPKAMEFYGNEEPSVDWVDLRNVQSDPAIEVWGNLAGKTAAGLPCNLGDCSTRQDLVYFNHVVGYGPNAGFIYAHDQTYGTNGSYSAYEGGLYGIKVRCAAGQPSISYCPQHFRWFDFESEFGTIPLDLQDFTYFECSHCYFAGISGGGSPHVITATLVNYAQGGGGGGGFYLDNAVVFGSNGSCVLLGVTDVHLDHNSFTGCNLSGNPLGTNDANVEFQSGSNNNAISSNNFCTAIGAGFNGANTVGLLFDAGSYRMNLSNNTYFGCAQNQLNNAGLPNNGTIYEVNPNPNPPFGTISGVTGCGSGCTVAGVNGNELGGIISIVAGAGSGSGGSFTLSLPQPLYPQANCAFFPQNGASGWQFGASAFTAPTASSVIVNWSNNGINLVPLGTYLMDFSCKGF